ncbi:MAG: ThiF family adenylyltransferase, partial [Lachnospiraceae bacterium]|nr:ThiF family adenylyltransferase [Lachnospiraceae bacterium]
MNEIFIRTAQILGEDGFQKLQTSSVAVFGLGGVGSHCAEALARSGVGTLFLIDSDVVAPSNINRQSIALISTIGRKKTEVLKEKIRDINPDCQVVLCDSFVLPDNIAEVFAHFPGTLDYIIDAIDTVSAKLALVSYAKEHDIPIICSMGTGNKLHPELFKIADIYKTNIDYYKEVITMELISVRELFKNTEKYADQTVTIGGWVRNRRPS